MYTTDGFIAKPNREDCFKLREGPKLIEVCDMNRFIDSFSS